MMSLFRLVVSSTVIVLAACGGQSEDELREWMAEQKTQTHPKITPISEPQAIEA